MGRSRFAKHALRHDQTLSQVKAFTQLETPEEHRRHRYRQSGSSILLAYNPRSLSYTVQAALPFSHPAFQTVQCIGVLRLAPVRMLLLQKIQIDAIGVRGSTHWMTLSRGVDQLSSSESPSSFPSLLVELPRFHRVPKDER
jgi:hypothetical protein